MIEPARVETEDALRQRFDGDERPVSVGRTTSLLTPAQIEALEDRLRAIIDESMAELPDPGDEAREYSFTYALVPAESS